MRSVRASPSGSPHTVTTESSQIHYLILGLALFIIFVLSAVGEVAIIIVGLQGMPFTCCVAGDTIFVLHWHARTKHTTLKRPVIVTAALSHARHLTALLQAHLWRCTSEQPFRTCSTTRWGCSSLSLASQVRP